MVIRFTGTKETKLRKMKRTENIASRLREVFLNGKWVANTNYKEQLDEVDLTIANKTVFGLNTIAVLTFHVNYYLAGLLDAFRTGELTISDKFSFDAPALNSEEDWRERAELLLDKAGRFANEVERMDDALLDQPFIDARYGMMHRNLEAVLEHSYYHLGQIVIIKKLLTAQREQA